MTDDEIRALLEAATPGPWGNETVRTSCGVCHKIGPWPHKWRHGNEMSACIYDDYPSPPEGTDNMLANARLIASAPSLAAEVLRLREVLLDAAVSLVAAVSLLERGGKKAAPSDKMFAVMLDDYRASIERARAALKGAAE